mmetsp:Transcript_59701/g.187170  ORF Transcript_59701/g.187170 Transcript_59701/m.187170 type:complete len:380 (+) Transcript_59701:373-1512(+)
MRAGSLHGLHDVLPRQARALSRQDELQHCLKLLLEVHHRWRGARRGAYVTPPAAHGVRRGALRAVAGRAGRRDGLATRGGPRVARVLAEVLEQPGPPAAPAAAAVVLREVQTEDSALHALIPGHVPAEDRALPVDAIRGREQNQAVRRTPITASSPALLHVGLEARGEAKVHHTTHVGLVDTHAKGHGGHDHLQLVASEGLLRPVLHLLGQARVEGCGPHAAGLQQSDQLIAVGLPLRVDDGERVVARRASVNWRCPSDLNGICTRRGRVKKLQQPALHPGTVGPLLHCKVDVRPVHCAHNHVGLVHVQIQRPDHVSPYVCGASGGDTNDRRCPASVSRGGSCGDHAAELAVLRPEVEAPLGHAMGFVDGQQRNPQDAR